MALLTEALGMLDFFDGHLLSVITFLPLLGALLIALMRREHESEIKSIAILFSLITAGVSLILLRDFDSSVAALQLVESHEWLPFLGVRYELGIDGVSILLVLLTTMLTPIVLASASGSVHSKVKEYMISMLVLETGVIGSFLAADLFLFYVFFEVMLVPMYLLIGVWGGPDRVYAAVKFFIYTLVGSLLMFVAILYCYHASGLDTFNIARLTERLPDVWAANPTAGTLCFLAFMLSFAIKTPMFPFHTWLPDAHTEAPTGGSVILAGVMLKLGTYGMLRFGIGMFPAEAVEYAPWLVALAVIGIIYGALMAIAQDDLKRLVAYSSVSHLGFVVLGLFAFSNTAAHGAMLQMINHGISTPLLFLCVGVIYDRRHTRMIADYGGIAHVMPKYAVVFMIATLASIGLPGLNGFAGEFLILIGSFNGDVGGTGTWTWMSTATLLAGTGVILGAVYMLWAYQRVFFGKVTRKENTGLKDLTAGEMSFLLPVCAACFVFGVMPNLLIGPVKASVNWYYDRDVVQKAVADSLNTGAVAALPNGAEWHGGEVDQMTPDDRCAGPATVVK